MISVSRTGWNARPPESTTPLNRSKIQYFIVHYSGASRTQSVRSIQDFCMDVKDHSDIDYSRIVRGEYDYMGRGWNVGSHTLGFNSNGYGVCVIGVDGDATDADMRTVREIYDQVCGELGRQLIITDHRNLLGTSYTDCPGNELDTWVDAGIPYPETGGDVSDAYNLLDSLTRTQTGGSTYTPPGADGERYHSVSNSKAIELLQRAQIDARWGADGTDAIKLLLADLVVPTPAPIDPAALKAVLLDPEVLAAIAVAVADEDHRRSEK